MPLKIDRRTKWASSAPMAAPSSSTSTRMMTRAAQGRTCESASRPPRCGSIRSEKCQATNSATIQAPRAHRLAQEAAQRAHDRRDQDGGDHADSRSGSLQPFLARPGPRGANCTRDRPGCLRNASRSRRGLFANDCPGVACGVQLGLQLHCSCVVVRRSHQHPVQVPPAGTARDAHGESLRAHLLGQPLGVLATGKAAQLHQVRAVGGSGIGHRCRCRWRR